ncbi:MAG: hypothetical protein HY905_14270 [Deltaproteobacteria bacterium]|nr:hypothetical protein [Deltaproteobacteria bacterium]
METWACRFLPSAGTDRLPPGRRASASSAASAGRASAAAKLWVPEASVVNCQFPVAVAARMQIGHFSTEIVISHWPPRSPTASSPGGGGARQPRVDSATLLRRSWASSPTAPDAVDAADRVRIVRPFHSLSGQDLVLVCERRNRHGERVW